jgi:hypothetical protein
VSGNWDEGAPVPHQQLDADTILRTLIAHEVGFIVIGGLTVGAHGYPRATKDLDAVAAVPDRERERRRRIARLQQVRLGTTHPPTGKRIELLERRRPESGAVRLDPERAAALQRELQALARPVAERLVAESRSSLDE